MNTPARRPVVVTRKHGERVILEYRNIKISVELRRSEGKSRLAILAPAAVKVYREELKQRGQP